MVRTTCCALLVWLAAAIAAGQDCGAMFSQSIATLRDEKIQVVYQVTKPVFEAQQQTYTVFVEKTEPYTVTVDGKQEQRTRTVKVPVTKVRSITVQKNVCEMRTRELDESSATACDAAGKPLDWATLTQRLAKPTLVVVTTNGQPLGPKFAALFKPETIIFAPPVVPQAPIAMPPPEPEPRPAPPPVPSASNGARRLRPAVQHIQLAAFQAPADDATPQAAVDIPQLPATPAPAVKFATLGENGNIGVTIVSTSENTAYVTVSKRNQEGKDLTERIPVIQRYETRASTMYPVGLVEAVTVDGRKLPAEILTRFLKTERAVLVVVEGEKVDKFWLQNMKPTVVILSVPPLQIEAPVEAPPPPVGA